MACVSNAANLEIDKIESRKPEKVREFKILVDTLTRQCVLMIKSINVIHLLRFV